MIVTLTPNPSVDRTIAVDTLIQGEVNRASGCRIDPGGKGVNVSRALAANNASTVAVLPIGGPEGRLLGVLLNDADVPWHEVPIAGTVRMNVAVVEPDGTTTKINEPGPVLDVHELAALTDAVVTQAAQASWVVICGSLPPGAPVTMPMDLIRRLRRGGVCVAVDTSGAPLLKAVSACPDLIKPNREELEELVGHPLATIGEVVAAAQGLVRQGVGTVVVSLGADGAVLVDAECVLQAQAPITKAVSTVGAGDCLLAGILCALDAGLSREEALATGVRWGAAAVSLPGSQVPHAADLVGVEVVVLDRHDPAHQLTA